MTTLTLDPFALVITIVLAVGMPLTGVRDMRRLRRWLGAGRRDARLASYRDIMIMEWCLALGLLTWWLALGRGAGAAGLGLTVAGWQWLAVGLGVVGTVLLGVQMVTTLRDPSKLAEVTDKARSLADLVPRTEAETRRFDALSVTAGICEEVLYRGLLLGSLTPLMGVWPAVAVSSVVFGLGHAYQGAAGVLKTGVVGLVLALLTVFSGSLWVAMVLHAALDLTSGRLMRAGLRAAPGGDAGPQPPQSQGPALNTPNVPTRPAR
jgi:membrane protease YdiL (CAAX protease family)